MACNVHLVPLDTPLSVAMGQRFSFNVIGAPKQNDWLNRKSDLLASLRAFVDSVVIAGDDLIMSLVHLNNGRLCMHAKR